VKLNQLERALLNNYQREFPLSPDPFRVIAEQLGTDEDTVLDLLKKFRESGVLSRIGPVFRPNTIGASTLAAMSVPESRLVEVAGTISSFAEVNHNYEREHQFNLWFVVNTATPERRDAVLVEIERETGFNVMSLPLLRDYYINLGFDIDFSDAVPTPPVKLVPDQADSAARQAFRPGHTRDLISALQAGLPLSRTPYAEIGSQTGMSERIVRKLIGNMLGTGAIKRFGVVVRHHELGYRANAMCVWDVPDDEIDALGEGLAEIPYVTLCYRRPRQLPHWPYNLFCIIHGKDLTGVVDQIERLVEEFGLQNISHDVLFSGRRFKQRGAFYRHHAGPERGKVHTACG
jgi:DNA-binding Lrp family transcriptional regulator